MTGEPERRQLFNGRDLSGWQMAGPGRFSVEDACLKTEGGMGLLWYAGEKLGDCVLRVVYRTTRHQDNSGVFIRIKDVPPDPWFAVHNGYEVQIDASQDDWHVTGVVYSLTSTGLRPQLPPGDWNTMDIEMDGEIVRVTVNAVRVTEFDPSKPVPEREKNYEPERGPRARHGFIGLQNHDANSVVYFREVSVAPLASSP